MRLEQALPEPGATDRLGRRLSKGLRPGDVICLRGPMGAGKTTLTRGLVHALVGDAVEVTSPTFNLVQTYETPIGLLWHFDLYRLDEGSSTLEAELMELGWEEAADGIAVIEWPSRVEPLLPRNRLDLTLRPGEDAGLDGGRLATLEPRGEDWQERLYGF